MEEISYEVHNIKWDDEKISRLWNFYSNTPKYSIGYFSRIFGRSILKKSGILKLKNANILDFGCGPGYIFDYISEMAPNWNYSALDFSDQSIVHLIGKAQSKGKKINAIRIMNLPTSYESELFDIVLLLEVVEHLNDNQLEETLTEIKRLLKPGGKLLISTPNEEDLQKATKFCPDCGCVFHEWQHVRNFSKSSLIELLVEFGYIPLEVSATYFDSEGKSIVRIILSKLKNFISNVLGISMTPPHLYGVFQKY